MVFNMLYTCTLKKICKKIYVYQHWNNKVCYTNRKIFPQFLAYSLHIKLNPKSENGLRVWCMRTDKLWTNIIFLCFMIWHIAAREEVWDGSQIQVLKYKNIQQIASYRSIFFRLKSVRVCAFNLLRVFVLIIFVTRVKRAWKIYLYRRSHCVSALPKFSKWKKNSFL
jgi:hypothetical protein